MSIIVPFSESKYLCFSSLFMLYPIYFSMNKKMYYSMNLSLLAMLISINYWRNATYSWRRDLDLIVAKATFFYYVINGIIYIPKNYLFLIGINNNLLCILSFYLSNYLWKKNYKYWYIPHMGFHGITAYGMYFILKQKFNVIRKF